MSNLSHVEVMEYDGDDPLRALINLQQASNQFQAQANVVYQETFAHLDRKKADKREVQILQYELADAKAQLRALSATTSYFTAKQLETELKCSLDCQAVGAELSKLCRDLGIKKEPIPDPRFGSVGAYHPFVCRVWCERSGYPVPTCLLTAKDPRG